MSGLTRTRSKPTEKHEPYLLFDVSLKGFYFWSKKRFELIGVKTSLTHYKHDFHIVREAVRKKAIVVTTDKSFPYEKKIVLPMSKPKYEVWITLILKTLSHMYQNNI